MRDRATLVQAIRLALAVLVMVPLLATATHGQDREQIEKDANEIYNSLLSPFCPGRLIANCPSSQATDLRNQIRNQLEAGATKDEVIDELYAIWGEEVLGGRRGPLSYGVPIGVILLAGGLMVMWLRSTSRRSVAQVVPAEQLDPAAEKRLEEELAELGQ